MGNFGRYVFAVFIHKLQRVPVARIMTRRNNNAARSVLCRDGQFGRRCCGEADINDVEAHTEQRAANAVADHFSGDARIAPYDDFIFILSHQGATKHSKSRHGFYDVKRIERIARFSADRSAKTGDGFNKCHTYNVILDSFRQGMRVRGYAFLASGGKLCRAIRKLWPQNSCCERPSTRQIYTLFGNYGKKHAVFSV